MRIHVFILLFFALSCLCDQYYLPQLASTGLIIEFVSYLLHVDFIIKPLAL